MAKKKQKTNAIRQVEQKKIAYNEYTYEWSEDHLDAQSVAAQLARPQAIYKTLVAVGNKTGPLVAVIPGNREVDLKKLAKVSGNKKVDAASERFRRDDWLYSRRLFADRDEKALSYLY